MKILFVFFVLVPCSAFSQEGWYKQTSGTEETLYRVQFFSPTNGWISGDPNAYRTTDGGEHWTMFAPPPLYRYFYFMDETTAFAVGTTPDVKHSTVIKTTDMGQTWSEPFQTDLQRPVDMTHVGDTVFLRYEFSLLKSVDKGKTWRMTGYSSFSVNGITFANSQNGFIVGERGGFAWSQNGGEQWVKKDIGLPLSKDLYDVISLHSGRIFVCGTERTLMYSDDGGTNWDTIPKYNSVKEGYTSFSFSDDRNGLVVGSGGAIFRTTNAGLNWEAQNSRIRYPEDTSLRIFLWNVTMLDSLRAWAVGSGGAVVHTSDAGKSWVRQYLPDTEVLQSQVHPQPFATKTTITYELPKAVRVTVRIYDGLGKELQTISEPGVQDAGLHSVEFDGSAFSNEVFYYRIEAYPFVGTGKFSKVPF